MTRPVSQKDQDCISVLLSLKNKSSPTMTREDTLQQMTPDSRSSHHPSIKQTESSESMSTAATVSTVSSSLTTPLSVITSSNSINRGYSNGNGSKALNIPEPLYREENITPNEMSLCRHNAGTYFPHMRMVQQQMNMNFGPGQMRHPNSSRPGYGHPSSSSMMNQPRPSGNFNSMYSNSSHNSWSSNSGLHHSEYELASNANPSIGHRGHAHARPKNNVSLNGNGNGRSRRNKSKFNNPMHATPSPVDMDIHSKINANLKVQSEINLEDKKTLMKLVGGSDLVDVEDRLYIPDYVFLSMAQLSPCLVTPLDRIGTYKSREIGFKGMACKHCGGEPGFGRYFPETLRSLSQTTTSQTIVKHIAFKCRKCPKDIKNSVRVLKDLQDKKDQMAKEYHRSRFEERPKYGSRKVFFQRLWARLHEDGTVDSKKSASSKKKSPSKDKKDGKEQSSRRNSNIEPNHNNKSPGRMRLISYEDSEGENVPPSEEE